jgi:hypothetical protein
MSDFLVKWRDYWFHYLSLSVDYQLSKFASTVLSRRTAITLSRRKIILEFYIGEGFSIFSK